MGFVKQISEDYKGWTNQETWAVANWIDNDKETSDYWHEQIRTILNDNVGATAITELEQDLQAALEIDTDDYLDFPMVVDLLDAAWARINWHEIASKMIDSNQLAI